tara:strand:+ start:168 stop:515 length:348 start_codon:yes stop_codon:yes gene_type:complete
MEEKLKQARFALMTMFEVLETDIIEMKSRKKNKVYARMIYNYYLLKIIKIPHVKIKHHIKGMHHATSIYHKNKFEFDMKQYDSVSMEWKTFLFFADYQEWKQIDSIKEMKIKYIN